MKKYTLLANAIKLSLIALSASILVGCNDPVSAEQSIAQGNQYILEDNKAAAIISFKNALQVHPKSADVRFNLGKLYTLTKQYQSAEKELIYALKYGYDAAEALPLLSLAYEKNGTHVELSEIDITLVSNNPQAFAKVGYYKTVGLLTLNKIKEASLLINQIIALDIESKYKSLTTVFRYRMDKTTDNAEQLMLALKEKHPYDLEVLKTLAQTQLASGKNDDAAQTYIELTALFPEALRERFALSSLLVELNRTDEAEPYIDELLSVNDQNVLLNHLKSSVEFAQENYHDSAEFAEKAILNGSTEPALRLIAGYSSYYLEKYEAVNRHLSYIERQLPNDHPALKVLADSKLRIGLTGEAGAVLSRIDGLDKNDASLLSTVSYQLLQDGYVKNARDLIDKASSLVDSTEDLTRLGVLQLSINNLDGIETLEMAAKESSQSNGDNKTNVIQRTLIGAYIDSGQNDKALGLIAHWKENSQSDIAPYMLKAKIHVKLNEIAQAKAEYTLALNIDATGLEPQMALINLAVIEKDLEQAQAKTNAVLAQNPSYLPALAINYLLSLKSGEGEKGLELIKKAVISEPDNIGTALLLARIYAGDKRLTKSLDALNYISDKPILPESFWKLKGQVLVALGDMTVTKAHYDAWSLAYPYSKAATINQLLLNDIDNNFAKGAEIAKAFLAKRDDVQIQIFLTHFLIMNSDLESALVSYNKLPKAVLETPVAKRFLANFQLAQNKPEEALPNVLTAYAANPNYRNVILATVVYDRLEKGDELLAFLTKHVNENPGDSQAKMLLAELQYKTDRKTAIKHYEQAVQENPTHVIALNNLAYLYLQQGDIGEAKDYAQDAYFLAPNNDAIIDTFALVLIAERNYREAIEVYEKAEVGKDTSEDIYLNYVEALLLNHQFDLGMLKLHQKQFNESESLKRISGLKDKHSR